jgi:hypothetical protein
MVRGELERGIALDIAKDAIAARIKRVCANFNDAEFAALVEQMAEIEVRYRLRDDWLNCGDEGRASPYTRGASPSSAARAQTLRD